MAVDTNLYLKAGETPEAYKTRVASYQSSKGTTPIDASKLGQGSVKAPPIIPSTLASGTQDFIASTTASNKTAQDEIATLAKEQTKAKGTIASIYDKLTGQGTRSEEIYKQEGVDTAKKQVDEYTSQIEAEQLANTRQLQELDKNTNGLFGGALEAEKNRINRASLAKQADLAILQNAAVRKYDTASSIADRKIQLEFEPLKTQLDALKYFYSENQSLLSKKEDQLFQEKITADERAYNEKFQTAKTLQDTKLALLQSAASQSAPSSVLNAIQSATSPEGALIAAGQYAGDILAMKLKQQQLAKSVAENMPQAATELKTTALTSAQALLQKLLNKEGTSAVGKSGFLSSFGYGLVPGTKRADFTVQFDNLKSLLSLDNIKYLKGQGQVSDAERRLLAQASAKLDLSQSETEFNSALQDIIKALGGTGGNIVTAPDGTQVEIID